MSPETMPVKGLQAFAALRSEEEPWLGEVFLPPADFPLLTGSQSVVIYGDNGGGKSAVLQMIREAVAASSPPVFTVTWQPQFAQADREAEPWESAMLHACSMALLTYFAHHPQIWTGLGGWPQTFLQQYIRSYHDPDEPIALARMQAQLDHAGKTWLQEMLASPAADAHAPFDLVALPRARLLHHLAETITQAGWSGICLFIDGFERWQLWDDPAEADTLIATVRRFLSSLALFDQPGFTIKLALPHVWRERVRSAPAIQTRRFYEAPLEWDAAELVQMVEQRLQWAMADPEMTLQKLGPACHLPIWLERQGGRSPRRWLSWARSLLNTYLQKGRTITGDDLKQISRRMTPYLHFQGDGQVSIGPNLVRLAPNLYSVLAYLYAEGRVCSREELYYKAYKNMAAIPARGDPNYESPAVWRGVIDTAIYRLRQVIEPNPDKPAFILTVRSQGVKLARAEKSPHL